MYFLWLIGPLSFCGCSATAVHIEQLRWLLPVPLRAFSHLELRNCHVHFAHK